MKETTIMYYFYIAVYLFTLIVSASASAFDLSKINLPQGFKMEIYAEGLNGPRMMAIDESNNLYVTLTKEGKVVELLKNDKDEIEKKTIIEGLNYPHGITFFENDLYIAETNRAVKYIKNEKDTYIPIKKIIDLPDDGGHFTRTIAISKLRSMYISVGSSCNICLEKDSRRAAVISVNLDGSNPVVYAKGLRNTVGLKFHPDTKDLWGTDNGRDWLGDELPPDELNKIERDKHYGWPVCYGDNISDPKFKQPSGCRNKERPVISFDAHSDPLGMDFSYNNAMFPQEFQEGLFVALHGSWNRTERRGYKIVFVKFKDNIPVGSIVDFATGWLNNGKVIGRPVDILQGKDGSLFISDDRTGLIYRIYYCPDGSCN